MGGVFSGAAGFLRRKKMLTEGLIRLFIRDWKNIDSRRVRLAYGILAGATGIICNIFLCAVKLTVGILAGSIAIMADAMNNFADAGSSVVTILGFKLAAKPADDEHPFGHGRLEYVAGLVVAIFIIAVGLNFFKESALRIFSPRALELSDYALWFFALTIPVKFWMFFFNRKLGRKLDSPVLLATAFDCLSDILTSLVVLLSLLVSRFAGVQVDGIAGSIVALLIIAGGIKAVRETIDPLLGEPPDAELVKGVEQTILENPDVCGVHDLIMHNYGPGRYFASAHAEVQSDCEPVKIHDSLEATEIQVAKRYPVHLTLHCDPFDEDDPEYKAWRLAAVRTAEEINGGFKVYDFRMTFLTHRHLFFNLLVPRSCIMSRAEITGELQKRLRCLDPDVTVTIRIENAYV